MRTNAALSRPLVKFCNPESTRCTRTHVRRAGIPRKRRDLAERVNLDERRLRVLGSDEGSVLAKSFQRLCKRFYFMLFTLRPAVSPE